MATRHYVFLLFPEIVYKVIHDYSRNIKKTACKPFAKYPKHTIICTFPQKTLKIPFRSWNAGAEF